MINVIMTSTDNGFCNKVALLNYMCSMHEQLRKVIMLDHEWMRNTLIEL